MRNSASPDESIVVVVAWIERAIDGTAAGHHLAGTLVRLASSHQLNVCTVVADRSTPDGAESWLRKAWRIATLVGSTAIAARPHRVLVARFHPLLLPALLVWRSFRGKIVLSVQGSLDDLGNEYPKVGKSPLVRKISVWSARLGHVLIAGAPVIIDHVRNEMARPGTPILPIPNGVFVEALAAARVTPTPFVSPYVVFVGNLAEWQGIDVMAKAAQDPCWPAGIPLIVVGDGGERAVLEGLDNVILVGRKPSSEAARWYAHAYCAISMKRGQGAVGSHGYWPFKLIESAAVGVPIICSDARGMRQAAEQLGNAVIVPDGDSSACAAAVAWLFDDSAERDRLASAGLEAVHQFDWSSGATALLDAVALALEQ